MKRKVQNRPMCFRKKVKYSLTAPLHYKLSPTRSTGHTRRCMHGLHNVVIQRAQYRLLSYVGIDHEKTISLCLVPAWKRLISCCPCSVLTYNFLLSIFYLILFTLISSPFLALVIQPSPSAEYTLSNMQGRYLCKRLQYCMHHRIYSAPPTAAFLSLFFSNFI